MKITDVLIDGTKYHAINVIHKPGGRLIIRVKATSGQTLQCDYQKIHHICYEKGEETVAFDALLKSSGNNTKIKELEFSIVNE